MQIFNYRLLLEKVETEETVRREILDKAEANATRGLIQAELELSIHQMLLDQAEGMDRTKAEIKGYTDAIERDEKSINNWETQLKAIEYER